MFVASFSEPSIVVLGNFVQLESLERFSNIFTLSLPEVLSLLFNLFSISASVYILEQLLNYRQIIFMVIYIFK